MIRRRLMRRRDHSENSAIRADARRRLTAALSCRAEHLLTARLRGCLCRPPKRVSSSPTKPGATALAAEPTPRTTLSDGEGVEVHTSPMGMPSRPNRSTVCSRNCSRRRCAAGVYPPRCGYCLSRPYPGSQLMSRPDLCGFISVARGSQSQPSPARRTGTVLIRFIYSNSPLVPVGGSRV